MIALRQPTPADDRFLSAKNQVLLATAIPAVAEQLVLARHALARWVTRAGLSEDRSQSVLLATYEAMANVIVHAYTDTPGTFDLYARYDDDLVTITVFDQGQWQPVPRPGPFHGRGLPLIHTITDRAVIEHIVEGTAVTLTWFKTLAEDVNRCP